MNAPPNPALETLLLAFSKDAASPLSRPARALFLGAQAHPELSAWSPGLTGWQPFKPLADGWDTAGFRRVGTLPEDRWPLVMILPGKSRDETFAWFAMARDHLEPGGTLVAAMPNSAGAGRYEKELTRATGRVSSIQKHKCRAFHATDDGTWDEPVFDTWRNLTEPRFIPESRYLTCPGVFSADHIDPGSRFLAEHLPSNLHGAVADLGAGWGFLSDEVLRRCPGVTRIDLFEADQRALDCARRNLSDHHGAAREIHFHWHDVTRGVPGGYDAVVTNPPFHTGQATDTDLGRTFIIEAAAALRRGGRLFLVANRQLPYEATLQGAGLTGITTRENATYKIVTARKG